MIDYIKGKIIYIKDFDIVVEVGNFAFKLKTPSKFKINNEEIIYIEHFIKDEQIKLYGFKTTGEREIFNRLININGVGIKQALKLLKNLGVNEIYRGVKEKDIKLFSSVSGIGKKLSQRIILELSEKLVFEEKIKTEENLELIQSLKELGYKSREIDTVLKEIPDNIPIEEKLKKALSLLAKGKYHQL